MKYGISFIFLSIIVAAAALSALAAVPAQAVTIIRTSPDGRYTSPDPDHVYGSQFAGPDLIADPRWDKVGFSIQDPKNDTLYQIFWKFEFWLTPAQHDELHRMRTERWDTPILSAMDTLVPEQVAALPGDLVRWIDEARKEPPHPHCLAQFTIVPFEPGVPLYTVVNGEYTDAVKAHLENLGLSSDYDTLALTWTTQPPTGEMLVFHGISGSGEWVVVPDSTRAAERVVIAGNTPDGRRKSWTFHEKVVRANFNGTIGDATVWYDEATGRQADADQVYLLAALCFSWESTPVTLAEPADNRGAAVNGMTNTVRIPLTGLSGSPTGGGTYSAAGLLSGYTSDGTRSHVLTPVRKIPLPGERATGTLPVITGPPGSVLPGVTGPGTTGAVTAPAGAPVAGTDSWQVRLPKAPA